MCCLSITIGKWHTGIKSMEEIWKPVVGYEGLYEVSNEGRVKSIRKSKDKNRNITIQEKIVKPWGLYKQVYLPVRNKDYVHRLVAKAFIPNPENKPYVNHIDNNPGNNKVGNLEWCTQKENVAHSSKQYRNHFGEKNGMRKLTNKNVEYIRNNSGKIKRKILSKMFKITLSNLSSIINRKSWKHI